MFHFEDKRGSIDIDWSGCAVASLKNGGVELVDGARLPLFTLRLRMPDGSAKDFCGFDFALVSTAASTAVYALDGLTVTLTVRFGGENWSAWRMSVENATDGAVEWTDFPQIGLRRERDGEKAHFYWPYNEGVRIDDIDLREQAEGWNCRETEFPGMGSYALFPGMIESQFVAYELGAGLYMGAHDEARGLKNIDIVPLTDNARLKMRAYRGSDFGKHSIADYDIAVDLFDGGWEAAAEIYRRWNDAHLPKGLQKIAENPDLPEWYGESPVVVTYPVRGLHDMDTMTPNRLFPYENALPRIDALAEKMRCKIMVLLMHWEGTAPWAPPFVWPPYGGEAALTAFAQKLHDRGDLLGVYLSGIGWSDQSNLIADYSLTERMKRENAQRFFTVSPEGKIEFSKICTAQRRGYDLCPACRETAEIVAGEVRSMAAAGIDYAQILDQNHGGNPYFCYGRDHGHAPTPGAWMQSSMRKLLDEVHEVAPNMLFGCESAAGEPFLPRLLFSDNRFNLGWFYGEPIPMFAYVYHEYLNNFMGNQVCAAGEFAACPDSLTYRLAYAMTAGDLPTLVLTDDGRIMQAWGDRQFENLPDEAQAVTLIRNLTALRLSEGKKYLHEGRMLPSRRVEGVPTRTFRMNTVIKTLTVPAVLTSRWQAPDGSVAQVLVNWTAEPVACTVGGASYTVPALDALLVCE